MKTTIGVFLLVTYLGLDTTYAQDATGAMNDKDTVAEGSPIGDSRAARIQNDSLTRRRILKEIKNNASIADETKKAIGVKVIGNTIYLQGPLNSIEEKTTVIAIVTKQGPRYKINDTTVIK